MKLPRRHYLALAGVETQLFKSLHKRKQIPLYANIVRSTIFEPVLSDEDMAAYGYSANEAIMLAIADNLVTCNSFSRDAAKVFVQGNHDLVYEAIEGIEAGKEIWIAGFTPDYGENGSKRVVRNEKNEITGCVPSFAKGGTLVEVLEQIDAFAINSERKISTINLINITPIMNRAKAAAEENGITGSFLARV